MKKFTLPKRYLALAAVALSLVMGTGTANAQKAQTATPTEQAAAAKAIIDKFTEGKIEVNVIIDLVANDGKDKFSYTYSGSTLTIHASNGVSACRGFYDFVKSNGAGICSWSANRFEKPANPTKTTQAEYTSPYRHHQYFNVVTYGYSTPYWNEDRWDQEIAWMAMHGMDMPLMLIGSEAIYRDVFKALYDVTDDQLDAWEVGPAHLPWMRMGNLAGTSFDGPLGANWHTRQRQLAHHVLAEMRKLGMKPIVPAFGGFVPKAVADKIQAQGGHYSATGWNWIPANYKNYRLTPTNDGEFKKIGKKFIELWDAEYEKSYGEFKYYLSDSFNEMDVPSDVATLNGYGEQIYSAIKEGSNNNDAVWVTQGWEFIYGSGKWTNGSTSDAKFKALTKAVPNSNFMVISMSPEYGGYNNVKWELYDNYAGKDWINTMLPNMGGKNFWTGKLQDYATTFPNRLWNSAGSNNCRGWGMTMEGIEYNEMLYELIADMGWETNHTKNLDNWVTEYGKARYGNYTSDLQALHTTLRNTVYTSYIDHQNFGWQGNGKSGNYYQSGNIGTTNDTFFNGFETFFGEENIERLKNSGTLSTPLRADLMEFAAFYAAARVEKICQRIISAKNMNDKAAANELLGKLQQVMLDMDYVLSGHPLYDEAKWEAKAVAMAGSDVTTQEKYRKNARRIVSTWYGNHQGHEAVNDYASRIYSGLIRDYYLPRLYAELDGMINGTSYNLRDIERTFIPNGDNNTKAPALTPVCRVINGQKVNQDKTADKLTDAELLDLVAEVVATAREAGNVQVEKNVLALSNETESHWYAIHSNNPAALDRVFTATGEQDGVSGGFDIQNLSAKTNQFWRVIDNGDGTIQFENRNGQKLAYDGGFKTYRYAIFTDAQKDYEEAQCRYAFKLASASNWMHYNNSLQLYGYKNESEWFAGSMWTLQDVDAAVNEVSTQTDYDRYRSRLEGVTRWGNAALYGQTGQPKNAAALASAVAKLETRDLALETYTEFLHNKWYAQVATAFNVPAGVQAKKLFYMLLEAMDMPEVGNESAINTYRSAIQAAQQALTSNNETTCKSAITSLQSAIKTYMVNVPRFPFVSPAPAEGKFNINSKAFTMKVGNGGYVSTAAMDNDAFLLNNSTKPNSSAGYWIACGDDANGYTFYNVGAGAGKVLGISGNEADARAKLYDATSIPSGVTTKFFYKTNPNGASVFYFGANNAWNKRGNYLALWNSANAYTTADAGSAFTLESVSYNFVGPVLLEASTVDQPKPYTLTNVAEISIANNLTVLGSAGSNNAPAGKFIFIATSTPNRYKIYEVTSEQYVAVKSGATTAAKSTTELVDDEADAEVWNVVASNKEGAYLISPTSINGTTYLNYYQGKNANMNGETVGFWTDGNKDNGSVWVLTKTSHVVTGIDTSVATAKFNTIYNLMGQPIVAAKRGINIINGKKVVVK